MTMSSTTTTINNNDFVVGSGNNPFGDTTLTKVFVGGLAWETPREAMKEHFDMYGEILEAVVISDKVTGRSKGYGFVTFKDPEAAKKACEDATPMINGRRANCNLASLGARRGKSSPPPQGMSGTTVPKATALAQAAHPSPPLPHQGSNVVGLRTIPTTAAANPQVQWYYPAATTPLPFHQAIPFFGYSPAYIAANVTYNQKLSYNGSGGGGAGGYMNAHYAHHHHHHQVYPSQTMLHAANTLVPIYPHHQHHPPLYHHHPYHQAHTTMGLPAHIFPTTATTTTTSGGPISAVPAILSKPASIPPPPTNSVCLAVE
ncbi:hypothetical protein MLD38_038106 [Melastoma candidum]|uniref:Uncharacterized protein n=1 Tax=Melastoma candidum TaxID=119954 RepID=A0ACB9KXY8_9MYRT|nr:hypothetical protein MLD38_038106 [Melastoma candidum]